MSSLLFGGRLPALGFGLIVQPFTLNPRYLARQVM
jgi:hypothetical protein